MLEWLGDLTVFRYAGLLGVFFGLLGVILPGLVYRGREGEKYSFLNHYISELGERGVSRWAWIFNLCILFCGLAVTLATISLGLALPGFWAKLGLLFGVVTGVGLMMVGIFLMDNIKPHTTAAVTFFRGGLLMVLAFSLAILFQQSTPPKAAPLLGLVGLIPVLAFGYFLGLMWNYQDHEIQSLSTENLERPKILKTAIAEWAVYFSIISWVLVLSLAIG
jgi:hypothetical membrane protein